VYTIDKSDASQHLALKSGIGLSASRVCFSSMYSRASLFFSSGTLLLPSLSTVFLTSKRAIVWVPGFPLSHRMSKHMEGSMEIVRKGEFICVA